MEDRYQTERLDLRPLEMKDAVFIEELVNTQGWLAFIGDRNVHNRKDAEKYIQKILQNENVKYWIVCRNNDGSKIGVITFIKRDYLDHHDIGFAFLPQFSGQGYALEAAQVVLDAAKNEENHPIILATTNRENVNSIKLLGKLGLSFYKEIKVEEETLLVFASA